MVAQYDRLESVDQCVIAFESSDEIDYGRPKCLQEIIVGPKFRK